MPGTQIQRRRGTTAEHSTFTGAVGEVTVDTSKKTLVVHDGATAGGVPLVRTGANSGNPSIDIGTGALTCGAITASGNVTLGDAATDTLNVGNGGIIKDASGNVGIGVTPSAWQTGWKVLETEGTGNSFIAGQPSGSIYIGSNATYSSSSWKYKSTAAANLYYQSGGAHYWWTAPSGTAGNAITWTTAMTLDASGNLLVGTTSAPGNNNNGCQIGKNGIAFTSGASSTSGNVTHMEFWRGTSRAGEIYSSNSTTTVYSTSSDYRLKENVQPMTGALARISQLKPCTYTWKVDGTAGEGFIAHELQEVCPSAVSHHKDAVDADGNPVYQGVDASFLVATLTAAIQELKAENDALKARLDAAGL